MAGLVPSVPSVPSVPAIPIIGAPCPPGRDRRDKPGDDEPAATRCAPVTGGGILRSAMGRRRNVKGRITMPITIHWWQNRGQHRNLHGRAAVPPRRIECFEAQCQHKGARFDV